MAAERREEETGGSTPRRLPAASRPRHARAGSGGNWPSALLRARRNSLSTTSVSGFLGSPSSVLRAPRLVPCGRGARPAVVPEGNPSEGRVSGVGGLRSREGPETSRPSARDFGPGLAPGLAGGLRGLRGLRGLPSAGLGLRHPSRPYLDLLKWFPPGWAAGREGMVMMEEAGEGGGGCISHLRQFCTSRLRVDGARNPISYYKNVEGVLIASDGVEAAFEFGLRRCFSYRKMNKCASKEAAWYIQERACEVDGRRPKWRMAECKSCEVLCFVHCYLL
ncbi:uncharacterized protein LOC144308834 [Canis aureus]